MHHHTPSTCATPPSAWSQVPASKPDELEARIARLAASDPGFHFLSLADLVPPGDRSFHAADMIHPSVKASSAIGQGIARIIRNAKAG